MRNKPSQKLDSERILNTCQWNKTEKKSNVFKTLKTLIYIIIMQKSYKMKSCKSFEAQHCTFSSHAQEVNRKK